jgi:hypothetical protein
MTLKKKTPNKQQLSHVKKEKRKKNFLDIIKFAGFTIIAVVVGLVGAGMYEWYKVDYKPMHEVVVDVNGTQFDMSYYIDMLTYVSGQYSQYASYFTSYALQYTEDYELLRQNAEKLGITVTEKEISDEIKKNKTDNTQAARDMTRASLLITKLKEHFGSQIATSAEQNNVMAMLLESEQQVEDVKARIGAGESFGDIAAELSLDSTTQKAGGVLGWLPDGVIDNILGTKVLTDELISAVEMGVLNSIVDADISKNVGYWILKVTKAAEAATTTTTTTNSATATVKAILVGSEEEAEKVLALLNDGGNFDTVAEEYSQTWDSTKGSVLEVTEGTYSDVFEAYALNPDVEIDAISNIIRDTEKSTTGGYWLYEVMDKGTQDISDTNMDYLIGDALDAWVAGFDYTTVVESLTDDMKTVAAAKVSGSLK